MDPALVSVLLLAAVSLFVVLPSMGGRPGFGVVAGLLIVAAATLARGEGLRSLGLAAPPSWGGTVILAAVLGLAIALISQAVIDPLVERIARDTRHFHYLSECGEPAEVSFWLTSASILSVSSRLSSVKVRTFCRRSRRSSS